MRASQLNGCAFCLQLHLNFARQLGVAAAKLDLVAAWREAGVFDERESAALAWTETLTRLGPEAASDAEYAALRASSARARRCSSRWRSASSTSGTASASHCASRRRPPPERGSAPIFATDLAALSWQ